VEADARWRWKNGHVSLFGGYINYGDNANNKRDVYYYSLEGVQDITRKFYVGARFGQIFAHKGFPIVGEGDMNTYLFGPLSDEMWRLSLGVGYRWSPHFVVKTEYTIERGSSVTGPDRNHEDFFATEAVFGF
jgi:hypothetical protein